MPKKEEIIYKRKDNCWVAQHGYGYCKTKGKAEYAKAALIMHEISAQLQRKKFSHYCDEWLRLNKIRIKESTYVKYNTIIEKRIKPKLGNFVIDELSSLIVEQFTYELLYEEKLSPKTVKDILIVLNSILKYSSRHHQGIFPNVEIYYPKPVKKEMRVLNKDEQMHLVNYLLTDTDRFKFATLLSLLTGMRIGEICALRAENIYLEEKIIKITSTMQRIHALDDNSKAKTKIIITEPKSDTSLRIIPLSDFTLNLCKKYIPHESTAFILSNSSSKIIEPRTLQYKMKKYCEDCGLKDVHFHTLRHTFATRCVEVGFEIKSLSEILGHSSPQITLERYVHSSLQLKRDNMNKLVI